MAISGSSAKRTEVQEGLWLLLRMHKQTRSLRDLKGLGWEGPGQDTPEAPDGTVVILVDSSVWISHLRRHQTPTTQKLEAAASNKPLLIDDLILLEVLRGARNELHAARIEQALRAGDGNFGDAVALPSRHGIRSATLRRARMPAPIRSPLQVLC